MDTVGMDDRLTTTDVARADYRLKHTQLISQTDEVQKVVRTSRIMKNSLPGSPCTTIFWPSSNCTVSKASATVNRSHLSSDSVQG